MNKDGVPFGVLTGILAIKAHQCGFEGKKTCWRPTSTSIIWMIWVRSGR